ncbi:hypothetical protein L208DRAFT_1270834 [Tricholoma matsutake]|nr:hypothetical protein L208DRAFT_1270834 [Tricholoma matsutake 945]
MIDLGEFDLTSGDIQQGYSLRGSIYYAADHSTMWFIAWAGMVWYHDGLFTGQSLVYEGVVQNLTRIPYENAIVGLYVCDSY